MKVYDAHSIRNVAVVGHSGSGKTQLVSALLFVADASARLEITDDGSGFDLAEAEQRRPGMGIFAMRERVSLVDGTIDIMSEPAGGTRIVVTVPLQAAPLTTTPEA